MDNPFGDEQFSAQPPPAIPVVQLPPIEDAVAHDVQSGNSVTTAAFEEALPALTPPVVVGSPDVIHQPWPEDSVVMEGVGGEICSCGESCGGNCGDEYGFQHGFIPTGFGPAGVGPTGFGPHGGHLHRHFLGLKLLLRHFQFFTGPQAFKGPANRGGDSSFGFHQGFNFFANVPGQQAVSFQIGLRTTQSNLNRSSVTTDRRNQLFVTGGVFRRVDAGLQGGAVVDYLHDEWDYDVDVLQIRGELSWVFPQRHELGFFFAASARERLEPIPGAGSVFVDTTDQFAFFHRFRFPIGHGAETRLFAGFSGDREGLIGSNFLFPLTNNTAFRFDSTYLIPQDTSRANIDESWNLSFGFVWYPGCGYWTPGNYCRPLFSVANNSSVLLNDKR